MALRHYLGLLQTGTVGTVRGVMLCAVRRHWAWTMTAVVPIAADGAWIGAEWVRQDWDAEFFGQAGWIRLSPGVLHLAASTAAATGRHTSREFHRSHAGGKHGWV